MRPLFLCAALVVAGCSGGTSTDAGSGADAGPGADAGSGSDGAPGHDGGPGTDAGPLTSCDPPGRYGVPTTTLTLVAHDDGRGGQSIYYDDVQAAFPATDWATLDRLYLPAGHYTSLRIGNLPVRDAARPLVITNHGGQVVIADNPMGNFLWSFAGGSNWVLTGRYDAMSQTGDAAFPGHACGHYAGAQYGLVSDDGFALMAPYLHMGVAVSDATDFEIEYVEVKRSGFAGIRLLNSRADGDPARPMANVRVHDVYIHDTNGEGFYFGWTGAPPANLFPGLQIYDCRLLRTGNEALQIQDLGDGTHVHHNTIIGGGLHWLDNGLGHFQDNLSQIQIREGTVEIDHNVFMDGAGSIGSFWTQPETGDGARHVDFHDDYFADTLSLGIYFGGDADASSSFTFDHDVFRDLSFGYTTVDPAATDPGVVLRFAGTIAAPISLTNDTWLGARSLVSGLTGGNGTSGTVTGSGNTNGTPPQITFVDPGYPLDTPGHHLTAWAPLATVATGSPPVTYHPGDIVTYGSTPDLYRCTADSTMTPPPMAPSQWELLPPPTDDVRTTPGSPYESYGVQ